MLMEQGARTVQIDLEFGQVIYVLLAIHPGKEKEYMPTATFYNPWKDLHSIDNHHSF